MIRILAALCLMAALFMPRHIAALDAPQSPQERAGVASAVSDGFRVRLTVYLPTGNVAYSGIYPYWGMAACSWNFPIGTVLQLLDGHQVTCLDRGLLGSDGWVDLFVPDWNTGYWLQRYYGEYTTVVILSWGNGGGAW